MQALAEHLGPRLLRVKGLVALAEAPERPAVVHAIQHMVHPLEWLPAWPGGDARTRIVLIAEGMPRHFPARLLAAIEAEVRDA
jgi:G3E family GTPase